MGHKPTKKDKAKRRRISSHRSERRTVILSEAKNPPTGIRACHSERMRRIFPPESGDIGLAKAGSDEHGADTAGTG